MKTVKRDEQFRETLAREDALRFATGLAANAAPNAALRRAAKRYRERNRIGDN